MEMEDARAWENYWRIHSQRGCVPDHPGIASVLGDCWREFAQKLPRRARVLDVGSGAGAVLENLGKGRPDLQAVGVDSIGSLPRNPNFGSVLTGISMEQLPFEDRSFDAISSQFGIEYSDLPRTIAEVARTAKKGALIRFVIHNSNGPVATQGKSRRAGLAWALEESGYFQIAERLIAARAVSISTTQAALKQAAQVAAEKFPREPVASEVVLALLQIVQNRESVGAAASTQLLRELRDQIRSEITTLQALLRSAKDEGGIVGMADLLTANNAVLDRPRRIVEPRWGLAIAWLLDGQLHLSRDRS